MAIAFDHCQYPFGAFFYGVLPFCRTAPWTALLSRGALFFLAMFCLARAIGSMALAPDASDVASSEPDRTRLVQDMVLAICLFSVALFASEPFIVSQTSETAKAIFPIRVQLPWPGARSHRNSKSPFNLL